LSSGAPAFRRAAANSPALAAVAPAFAVDDVEGVLDLALALGDEQQPGVHQTAVHRLAAAVAGVAPMDDAVLTVGMAAVAIGGLARVRACRRRSGRG